MMLLTFRHQIIRYGPCFPWWLLPTGAGRTGPERPGALTLSAP